MQWQSLRSGRPDSQTEWKDLRIDVGLADKLFEM